MRAIFLNGWFLPAGRPTWHTWWKENSAICICTSWTIVPEEDWVWAISQIPLLGAEQGQIKTDELPDLQWSVGQDLGLACLTTGLCIPGWLEFQLEAHTPLSWFCKAKQMFLLIRTWQFGTGQNGWWRTPLVISTVCKYKTEWQPLAIARKSLSHSYKTVALKLFDSLRHKSNSVQCYAHLPGNKDMYGLLRLPWKWIPCKEHCIEHDSASPAKKNLQNAIWDRVISCTIHLHSTISRLKENFGRNPLMLRYENE